MIREQKALERLEDTFEGHRERAEELRGSAPQRAAYHLLKAAETADQMADLENTERLARERAELAANMRRAAREEIALHSNDIDGDPTSGGSTSSPKSADSDSDASSQTGSTGEESSHEGRDPSTESVEDSTYFSPPPDLDFDAVGGMDDLVGELEEQVITPFTHEELAEKIGVGINNAILLYGPPGTGKTYMTEAMAGELGLPIARTRASELGSKYTNEGAENIADLFQEAREQEPCLVFLDELDSLATDRDDGPQKTNSEHKMVTELLQTLEEIQSTQIIVVGATNLLDDIDTAIRRSGRFNTKFYVGPPDAEARKEIFGVHLREMSVDESSIDTKTLVESTEGFSAADIEAVVRAAGREALLEAANGEGTTKVRQRHLLTQIDQTTPSIDSWERKHGATHGET